MQTHTAVIHIHLCNDSVILTVDGNHYEPASPDVITALTRAVDHLKNDPTIVNVITCKVVMGDRRRPPRAAEHVPLVDLMLLGQADRTPTRLRETIVLLPETKRFVEEAAKFIFLEHHRLLPETISAPQSSDALPEPIPAR